MADIKSLPFKKNSFDLTFADNVFQYIPQTSRPKALLELIRVTAGNIYLIEVNADTKSLAQSLGGKTIGKEGKIINIVRDIWHGHCLVLNPSETS